MKKILSFLIMLMALTVQVLAQVNIKGTVTDASTNEPLIGATIIEKGTTNGTITDFDGKFSFNTQSEKPTIVVSFIGYLSQEIIYAGQSEFNIVMKADITGLEEVMVVGYGTIKKSHSTGAIAQIKGNDVVSIQAARVDDALAGKLSGVMIQNQSGEPGADPKIQIRAASSISGDSNPLIVVDGFPISGSLATVNPNDIVSMEVLKDAASAAIYGSRGANGVILVTTKKGKSGKASISYNGYTSISNKYVKDIEMLYTASEWADKLETGIANGTYDISGVKAELFNFRLNAYKNAPDVVSIEEWLFKTGNTQSHDISINGGSEDVKVFASLGYLNTEGIAQKQGYEKYNGRMNVDANIGSKIKAGISMNGYYGQQDIVPHDMRDLLRAYSIAPLYHTEASIAFAQDLDKQAKALGLDAFDKGVRGTSYGPQSIYDLKPGDYFHDWHYGRSYNGIGGTGDAG
ncbi:SusC/RagA family TonB-linked outer membrane protein, partial [Mariniphaga sediminis]|uniref:SusC/RagA family TonB-linked outer membrane protein n=1 Tax=Mariniphaga sediminis TaxID=1628158 RepID=UPI0035659D58